MRILWIPHSGWHIPQRSHLFCRALAERHELHVTDWVADFSSPRDFLSRRYLGSFFYHRRRDGNITVHRVPRFSPALPFRSLRRLNTAIFSRVVQEIIDRNEIDVVVGTFVVPPPRAPRLIFDLFDDNVALWCRTGRTDAYAEEIARTEQHYLQSADAVVAASSVLADKATEARASGPVYLIPNGVDLEPFNDLDRKNVRRQLNVSGRLVGSIGNHDNPTEIDRMLTAAKMLAKENVTFLIAGRGSATRYAQERIRREQIENVILRGYVPASEAAALVAALDVGLCPYAKSTMDDARSPMRLLMYAAAGTPTVCTDLEEVRRIQFANVVLVDDNDESFAAGIRAALQLPRKRPPQITSFDLPNLVQRYEHVLSNECSGFLDYRKQIPA